MAQSIDDLIYAPVNPEPENLPFKAMVIGDAPVMYGLDIVEQITATLIAEINGQTNEEVPAPHRDVIALPGSVETKRFFTEDDDYLYDGGYYAC